MTTRNQNATSKQPKPNNARCQWRIRFSNDQMNRTHESNSPAMAHAADSGTLNVNAGYACRKKPGAATESSMNLLALRGIGWRNSEVCHSVPHSTHRTALSSFP